METFSFCFPAVSQRLMPRRRFMPDWRPPDVVWAFSELLHMNFFHQCSAHNKVLETLTIMDRDTLQGVSISEVPDSSTNLSSKPGLCRFVCWGSLDFYSFYSNKTSAWYFLAKIWKAKQWVAVNKIWKYCAKLSLPCALRQYVSKSHWSRFPWTVISHIYTHTSGCAVQLWVCLFVFTQTLYQDLVLRTFATVKENFHLSKLCMKGKVCSIIIIILIFFQWGNWEWESFTKINSVCFNMKKFL